MNEFDEPLTPDGERARAALATLREPPSARDEFRARLKREFAAGTIAPPVRAESATASRAAAPAASRPLARAPRRRGPAWQWALAAAAAFAIVAGARVMNQGPAWRLAAATGEGVATVDGRPIPIDHTADLAAALVPGARVRVPPGCQIELASDGLLAIQMTPETDATVPHVPGRWFARGVAAEIQSGEWRITTGPAFHGARLAVATPEAHVMVTGTTLAIICESTGTCVCVWQGVVGVGRDRGDMVMVHEGRRRYVFADDTKEPENAEMRPTEAAALPTFHDDMQRMMSK